MMVDEMAAMLSTPHTENHLNQGVGIRLLHINRKGHRRPQPILRLDKKERAGGTDVAVTGGTEDDA